MRLRIAGVRSTRESGREKEKPAKGLYLAIRTGSGVFGVIGIDLSERSMDAFENSVLLSILGECALAVENRRIALEKEQATVHAQNEQLRANLLRTISHDLRTPLTSISGNASNLLSNAETLDAETRTKICTDIFDDAQWLIGLVENLLSITRIEDGRMNLQISPQLMDEVVEETLRHISRKSKEHIITTTYSDEILLADMDARLIMQKIDPHTQKPVIGKDGKPVTEEKEVTIPAYKVVSVFDVSQTEGKELPDIAVDELTGDVDRYKDFFAALEKTSPVPIAFENIEGGSHGYYHLEDKRIAINEGMSELQTLKTAIHEIAHAKLHDIDLNAPKDEQQPHVDRRTREVEAESVAYTVCQHYGLDTSDYSFGYVAGWSSGRELSELKSSLETIRSAAAEIINSIDENLAELQKAQDKEQTAGQEQPTREGQEAAPEKPDPEAAAPGKSGAQEKAGAAPKEAFTPETIYRVRRNPYSDSRENSYLLQAYVTQENGRAKMGDVLYTGTPEKCRELMGQLKSGELTEGDVKQLYAKAQETAQTAGQDKDTFSIYQIKGGDETRDFRFEPYDRLQAAGNVVDRANYELVYSAPLAPETSLEDIYTRFNIDHPKDFKGHSLSVSDVVVLHQNGQDTAHYVDSVGFRQVPEFLQEQKQLTPDELTTGETIQTPRGTFHVTAMSREQIEAAGYGFHHQSDDGKYLIMGNGTRAFAVLLCRF